ncbi:hypothetical protein COLO4_33114 [Corchorus olitorius]|uniref:Uncharacterized protein n=1 Tax=Corchorus olitorius TaxID=93759 RepID=A0A1R3GWB5_9ROSI|nr:hypothetical protein COLO4_33114 [Corchorus olitorius]
MEKEKKMKYSKIIKELDSNPPPMPQHSRNCIESLGGTDIKLVMHKIILESKPHNRLSMTIKKIKNKYLFSDHDEETNLIKDMEVRQVKLVDPCLKVTKVNLTSWLIGATQAFSSNNQWHKFVAANADTDTLKTMAVFQIWSFNWVPRESQKAELGFALIEVGDVPQLLSQAMRVEGETN